MNKKTMAASFALVLTVSLVSAVGFAPPPSVLNYRAPVAPGTTITGPVTNIDLVNRMVQIKDSDGTIQTMRIDNEIEILHNGSPTSLENLSYNDIVTVSRK